MSTTAILDRPRHSAGEAPPRGPARLTAPEMDREVAAIQEEEAVERDRAQQQLIDALRKLALHD